MRSIIFPKNVSKLFPKASQLESYLGVPIRDFSNNMVGHLCIEDVKPMEFGIEIIDFLRIFASRIGSELAHEKLQNQLKTNIEYQKNYQFTFRDFTKQYIIKRAVTKNLWNMFFPFQTYRCFLKGQFTLEIILSKSFKCLLKKI